MKFIQKHTKIILTITTILLNCASCQLKFGLSGLGSHGGAGLQGGHGGGSSKGAGGAGKAPRPIPQSVCTIKSDPGFCNLVITRWYYDWRYHRCLPFMYTGCGGNINNFISPSSCNRATSKCHSPPPPPSKGHGQVQHHPGYHHHDAGEEEHQDPGYHYHQDHHDPGQHQHEEEEEEEETPPSIAPHQFTHLGHYAPTVIISG